MSRFCAFCGKEIQNDARFCAFCGATVSNNQNEVQHNRRENEQYPNKQDTSNQTHKDLSQTRNFREQYRGANGSWQTNEKKRRKTNKTAILIAIVCGLTVTLILAGGLFWPGFFVKEKGTEPASNAERQDAKENIATSSLQQDEESAPTVELAVTERPNPFSDVDKESPYYEYCLWALDRGIISFGTIEADQDITRADTVLYLWRAVGYPKTEETVCPFSDVDTGADYYHALLWGLEKGIVSGNSELFNPNNHTTRAETIQMLFRIRGSEADTKVPVYLDTAADSWYLNAVNWASESGILDHNNSFRFYPDEPIERGAFLVWLSRAIEPETAPEPVVEKQDSFRKLGIPVNLTAGGSSTIQAVPKENSNQQVRLSVTSVSYERFYERENYEARQGYVWRVAKFLVSGSNSDAANIQFDFCATYQDSNNIRLFWQERRIDELGNIRSTVRKADGTFCDVLAKPVERTEASDAICYYTVAVQTPEDYNDLCFCLCDTSKAWSEDECLSDAYTNKEEFVIFKMD